MKLLEVGDKIRKVRAKSGDQIPVNTIATIVGIKYDYYRVEYKGSPRPRMTTKPEKWEIVEPKIKSKSKSKPSRLELLIL